MDKCLTGLNADMFPDFANVPSMKKAGFTNSRNMMFKRHILV